jgi:hypothetical protein
VRTAFFSFLANLSIRAIIGLTCLCFYAKMHASPEVDLEELAGTEGNLFIPIVLAGIAFYLDLSSIVMASSIFTSRSRYTGWVDCPGFILLSCLPARHLAFCSCIAR